MPISSFEKYYDLHKLEATGRIEKFIAEGFTTYQKFKPDITLEEYTKYVQNGGIPKEDFIGKPVYVYNNMLYFADLNNSEKEFKRSEANFFENVKGLQEEDKENFFSSYLFDKYKKAYDCYKAALKKYETITLQLKPYKDYLAKASVLKNALEQKYYKKYLKEASFIFSAKEKEELNNYFLNGVPYNKPSCLKALSTSLKLSPIINAFNSSNQNKLDDTRSMEYEKKSIIRDRITYFKARELDLGDNYQAYPDSSEANKLWPSAEDIIKINNIFDDCNKEFNDEFYSSISSYKQLRDEVDSKNLEEKEDGFTTSLYITHKTFVNPNLKGDTLYPLVIIHANDNKFLDHAIVHELNHLYELSLVSKTPEEIEYLTGWDYVISSLSDKRANEKEERRNYELFNETINELIDQDISKKMLDDNLTVFNEKEEARYKAYTSYEQAAFLIKDFYHEYFDTILESRKDGNIKLILDEVGEDNFDSLNDLIVTFNNNFSGFKYNNFINDINGGKETDRTRLYNDLITKKDLVLEDMKSYSKDKANAKVVN